MTYRVLVVDDYPDAANVICSLLTIAGYDCRGATNGTQALLEARDRTFDIALIDIGLPDISGYEVAAGLRRYADGRPMFLAAITGWGQTEDRVRALAAGFDHLVLKPVDAGILTRLMDLARARLGRRDRDSPIAGGAVPARPIGDGDE